MRTTRHEWDSSTLDAALQASDNQDNQKLNKTFTNSEKWLELDTIGEGENLDVLMIRYFVRHPRYPACTAILELDAEHDESRRTIRDDGGAPMNVIRQIAKYLMIHERKASQEYKGGCPPKVCPGLARNYKEAEEYYKEAGEAKLTQQEYVEDKDFSRSTLTRSRRIGEKK